MASLINSSTITVALKNIRKEFLSPNKDTITPLGGEINYFSFDGIRYYVTLTYNLLSDDSDAKIPETILEEIKEFVRKYFPNSRTFMSYKFESETEMFQFEISKDFLLFSSPEIAGNLYIHQSFVNNFEEYFIPEEDDILEKPSYFKDGQLVMIPKDTYQKLIQQREILEELIK